MADLIIRTGDKAIFSPVFGMATVVVLPGILVGTGRGRIGGRPVCVEGDEKKVIVPGCVYMTARHTIPGVGMLSIQSLGRNQKARKTKSGGRPVLLKGSSFRARFRVMVPAMQPPPGPGPPIPDTTLQYSGSGRFITTNFRVRGS